MSKKIMVLWFFVIFTMCATLVIIYYNSLDKDLLSIENDLKKASFKFFKDNNMLPGLNDMSIVFVEDLIEGDYIKQRSEFEEYCIDSVSITNKLFIRVYDVKKDCDVVIKDYEK